MGGESQYPGMANQHLWTLERISCFRQCVPYAADAMAQSVEIRIESLYGAY